MGYDKDSEKIINPAELKIASQFAGNLFGMLKAVHLYPKGHQMLLQVLGKFFDYLNYMLGERQIVTIRIFASRLYVLDICLPLNKPPGIDTFIEDLQKRYIRQITFNIGVTITDVTALIEVLNTDPKTLAKEGGASIKLAQAGAQSTKLIEYYYRRHATIDQERLLALSNSEIFRFFTDDMVALDSAQAHILYDLLKEPGIISALMKVAAQFILRDENCKLTESQLILNLINRIKVSMSKHAISEKEELQVILQDVVASFDATDLMSLIFDNPDNEILAYTNAIETLSKTVTAETTAQLITEKIQTADKDNVSILAHTKKVLGQLFIDRESFLNFLPIFREKLQSCLSQTKVKEVVNEICAAFAPGFSFEDGEEMALGTISDMEFKDIVEGLNILKTVHPDKLKLENNILEFSMDNAHLGVLKYLLCTEGEYNFFENILNKLISLTENIMKQDYWEQTKDIFSFLQIESSPDSALLPKNKQLIIKRA